MATVKADHQGATHPIVLRILFHQIAEQPILSLHNLTEANLELIFSLAGQWVQPCVFFKTESDAATGLLAASLLYAPVTAIFVPYRSSDIDGSVVLVGDEKAFVRAGELAGITAPGPGDNLVEVISGQRRVVIASRLDPTGSFWTFQARRAGNQDFGDLTAATAAEDWGDLTATPLFDDLQN
jgi:hypothetical protein